MVKISSQQVWPSVFLIGCLIMLVLVKISAYTKVVKIVQSTFSAQVMQQMEREEINPLKFHHLALNMLFLLNLSFLCYKINGIYKFILVEESRLVQFGFFVLLVSLVFFARLLANYLLALFTNERKLVSEYSVNASLINQTFGLLMFPWIILSEFSTLNPLVFISGAVIILISAVLLKWYRGAIIGLVEERIGLLQIFSYFCGLEILPVLVLVKFVIETF